MMTKNYGFCLLIITAEHNDCKRNYQTEIKTLKLFIKAKVTLGIIICKSVVSISLTAVHESEC